jgi:hypothetical protein
LYQTLPDLSAPKEEKMRESSKIEKSLVNEISELFKKHRKKNSQKKSRKKLILLIVVAVVFTSPLLLSQNIHSLQSASKEDVTYYKIKRISLEYPADLQPTIQVHTPSVGCAHSGSTMKPSIILDNGMVETKKVI